MLRRDATLITIRESDVDELKEILAARQKEREQCADDPDGGTAPAAPARADGPHVAIEEMKRKREAMTREQRLGIE